MTLTWENGLVRASTYPYLVKHRNVRLHYRGLSTEIHGSCHRGGIGGKINVEMIHSLRVSTKEVRQGPGSRHQSPGHPSSAKRCPSPPRCLLAGLLGSFHRRHRPAAWLALPGLPSTSGPPRSHPGKAAGPGPAPALLGTHRDAAPVSMATTRLRGPREAAQAGACTGRLGPPLPGSPPGGEGGCGGRGEGRRGGPVYPPRRGRVGCVRSGGAGGRPRGVLPAHIPAGSAPPLSFAAILVGSLWG